MPLKRQWFRPGRRIEQLGKVADHRFFTRVVPGSAAAAVPARRRFLPTLAENMGALFSIAISAVLITAIAALVYAFGKEIRREAVYLDPIDVPEDLAKRGFTAVVVTDRLLDYVREIQAGANTRKARQGVDASAAIIDIQVPGGAFSMKALVRYVRSMLNLREQYISGEITRESEHLRLRLRERDRRNVTVIGGDLRADDIDALLHQGAEALVRKADPFVLASYYYVQDERTEKYERTLDAVQYVLSHPPADDDAWAWNLWGLVLQKMGKPDDALVKYRRAIAADPALSPASGNLINLLLEQGKNDEARKAMEFAAAAPNASVPNLLAIGEAYQKLNQPQLAFAMLQRVLAIDPTNEDAHASVGIWYWQMHRFDDAERELQLATVAGKNPIPLLFLEGIKLQRGEVDAAREIAERIKTIDTFPAAKLIAQGNLLLYERRFAQAAPMFAEAAVGGGGSLPYVLMFWGRALIGLGEAKAAIEKLEQALRLDPQMTDASVSLAQAYSLAGRHDEALALFAATAKIQPLHAQNYQNWSDALRKVGRDDEAAAKKVQAETLAQQQRIKLAQLQPP